MVNPRNLLDVKAHIGATMFGLLDDRALEQLCAASRVERYDEATVMHRADEPLSRLRLVVEGHIDIVDRHPSGAELAMSAVGPGHWVSWTGCFMDTPPLRDHVSSEGACYISVPTELVRRLCDENPAIYRKVIEELGHTVRKLLAWTGQSALVSNEQRMATLIGVQGQTQAGGLAVDRLSLQVTQSQLAQATRSSRQTTSALLKALETRGLIEIGYRKITVPSLARLMAFATADLSQ